MFQDIGIGILLTILVGSIYNIEPSQPLFALGIFFSLLPDIDMLVLLFPKESKIYKFIGGHRGLLHRPIVYALVAPFLFLIFGKIIGTLFVLGVFYHLVHDTIVLGNGIMWFWPLSERSYRFFPDRDGKITNTFLITWLPEEEKEVMGTYGSLNWVKDFYLTINPISIMEYGVLFLGLYLLFKNS